MLLHLTHFYQLYFDYFSLVIALCSCRVVSKQFTLCNIPHCVLPIVLHWINLSFVSLGQRQFGGWDTEPRTLSRREYFGIGS